MLVAYRYDDKEENYPLSCEWIKIWLFSMPHYNVFLPYVESFDNLPYSAVFCRAIQVQI